MAEKAGLDPLAFRLKNYAEVEPISGKPFLSKALRQCFAKGADALALPFDRVELRSGSSDLPDAGLAGGSGHTATAGLALHNAGCDALGKLTELAVNDESSPLYGAGNAGVIARDGRLHRRDDETCGVMRCTHMARCLRK